MAAGDIAALLIGKAKKAPEGDASASDSKEAAQAVLDAITAGDAGALDAALAEWCRRYEASEPEEG